MFIVWWLLVVILPFQQNTCCLLNVFPPSQKYPRKVHMLSIPKRSVCCLELVLLSQAKYTCHHCPSWGDMYRHQFTCWTLDLDQAQLALTNIEYQKQANSNKQKVPESNLNSSITDTLPLARLDAEHCRGTSLKAVKCNANNGVVLVLFFLLRPPRHDGSHHGPHDLLVTLPEHHLRIAIVVTMHI